MKNLILLLVLLVPFMTTAQTNNSLIQVPEPRILETSNCDQYREIMDRNIDILGFDDFGKSMIVGKNGEYYKAGMSDHFTSPPVVPDYIYEYDNINPYMAEIIIAHVDLYYCDLLEKENVLKPENDKTIKGLDIGKNEKSNISLFPNPTDGIINLTGAENIEQIVVFNSQGQLVKTMSHSNSIIDLSNLLPDMYIVYMIVEGKIQVEKVMLK